MSAIPPGTKAPTFELKTSEGTPYTSGALKTGEVAVLAFFKKSCPVCQLAFPFLEKIFKHHKSDSNVRFVAVAEEDAAGAREFAETYGLTMPMALDENPYRVSSQYGLITVPTVFLLRSDRTIDQTTEGFAKKGYEELAGKLAQATGKKPVAVFEGASVPDYKPG